MHWAKIWAMKYLDVNHLEFDQLYFCRIEGIELAEKFYNPKRGMKFKTYYLECIKNIIRWKYYKLVNPK